MDARAGIKHSSAKTRKKSQHNIEDYASIVEADADEPEREYESSYRGRVQDHRVDIQPQPLIILAQHRQQSPTNRYVPFDQMLEDLNAEGLIPRTVYLTNTEVQLDEQELGLHFASIAQLTAKIDAMRTPTPQLYLARAIDDYHVRDFEAALADLGRAEALDPDNPLVPFMAAQVRCRLMAAQNTLSDVPGTTVRLGLQRAIDELQRVIALQPRFVYAYYNLGCVYMSLHDYGLARKAFSDALNLDPRFPDAYYNRGLACILDGQVQLGLSDLSQAGEYGLYGAYNLIKRYSKQP